MILLDTHVWVLWVHQDDRLSTKAKSFISQHETRHIGGSAISCWEVAKLVEHGRLRLPMPTDQRLHAALAYPGVRLLELTPDIAADACSLPGSFHSDPADQIIVATARHRHAMHPRRRRRRHAGAKSTPWPESGSAAG